MDPKQSIANAKHTATQVTAASLHGAKKVALRTGTVGPLYRAANKAVTRGDHALARVRRVGTRKLGEKGYVLETSPRPAIRKISEAERKPDSLPESLPALPPDRTTCMVQLPSRINWSEPHRIFNLADREDRLHAYSLLLRSGKRADIEAYVDGPGLVELWPELDLPRDMRRRWAPLVAKLQSH